VRSDCDPVEALFDYAPIRARQDERILPVRWSEWKLLPKGVIAKIDGIDTPEQLQGWTGAVLETLRSALPDDGEGWYWADLEGLQVRTVDGIALGQVSHLFDAGGGTVMVVSGERERLLPFVVDDVVKRVSLPERLIEVDWDPDF
jgi:16S rRNA processing protein RimM